MKRIMLLMVMVSLTAYTLPQGNTFLQVRYLGGTVAAKVNPKEWDNYLTVTSQAIRMETKAGDRIIINPADVTGLSYGQEAHRRVGTMVALGILLAPLALVGLFHKTRQHFISIEYTTPDGKKGAMLLQGHKNNYRALLVALKGATGAPLYVAPEERKYIPASLNPVESTTPEPAASSAAPPPPSPAPPTAAPPVTAYPPPPTTPATATGTVHVSSTPSGAEIYVDGNFVGNTPAVLKLPPGQHRFEIKATGLPPWSREVQILSGSEISLAATLK